MALKKLYIGSVGPLLYDDLDKYEDGENNVALRLADEFGNTLFQVIGSPVGDEDGVRKVDLQGNWVTVPIKETSPGNLHDMAEDGYYLYLYSSLGKWVRFKAYSWNVYIGQLIGLGLLTYS